MKRLINATLALTLVAALGILFSNDAAAQTKTPAPGQRGINFVDQDGDGVCDNLGTNVGQRLGNGMRGKGFGPGNGTGNKGQGPKDGTGFGARATNAAATGVCDGTGPKGVQSRAGRK